MKNLLISCALLLGTISTANANPRYYFANVDQQVELQNSTYKLVSELQTKQCRVSVNISAEFQDAVLLVSDRHILVEISVYSKGKQKRITNNYLNLKNWMKFEYDVRQTVLDIC